VRRSVKLLAGGPANRAKPDSSEIASLKILKKDASKFEQLRDDQNQRDLNLRDVSYAIGARPLT
jgi:hypothetical protein